MSNEEWERRIKRLEDTLLAVLERQQDRGWFEPAAWDAEENQMQGFIKAIREERKALRPSLPASANDGAQQDCGEDQPIKNGRDEK